MSTNDSNAPIPMDGDTPKKQDTQKIEPNVKRGARSAKITDPIKNAATLAIEEKLDDTFNIQIPVALIQTKQGEAYELTVPRDFKRENLEEIGIPADIVSGLHRQNDDENNLSKITIRAVVLNTALNIESQSGRDRMS